MHVFNTLTFLSALARTVFHLYFQLVNVLAVTVRQAAVGRLYFSSLL